jgi:hypothetical protein
MTDSSKVAENRAVLAVHKATSESRPAYVAAGSEVSLHIAGTANKTDRASQTVQIVLSDAVSALVTKEGNLRSGITEASVIQARDDLYYGMIEDCRQIGWAQYAVDKKAGRLMKHKVDKKIVDKSKSLYGNEAGKNLRNKRKQFVQTFWGICTPEVSTDVLAILSPDGDEKQGVTSWKEVADVLGGIEDLALKRSSAQLHYGFPIDEPENIWFIPSDKLDSYPSREEGGKTIYTIRHGDGDSAYDTDVVYSGKMGTSNLCDAVEARAEALQRQRNHAVSDAKTIRAMVIPESHILTPTRTG